VLDGFHLSANLKSESVDLGSSSVVIGEAVRCYIGTTTATQKPIFKAHILDNGTFAKDALRSARRENSRR